MLQFETGNQKCRMNFWIWNYSRKSRVELVPIVYIENGFIDAVTVLWCEHFKHKSLKMSRTSIFSTRKQVPETLPSVRIRYHDSHLITDATIRYIVIYKSNRQHEDIILSLAHKFDENLPEHSSIKHRRLRNEKLTLVGIKHDTYDMISQMTERCSCVNGKKMFDTLCHHRFWTSTDTVPRKSFKRSLIGSRNGTFKLRPVSDEKAFSRSVLLWQRNFNS